MSRMTKAEIEQEYTALRDRMGAIYDELGDLLGVGEEKVDIEEEDEEDEDED